MIRRAALTVLLAVVVVATGCGGEKCATETPNVQAVASCTVPPGTAIDVPLRLCPTCNQSLSDCKVDTSQAASGVIQLDPIVEACNNSSSCPSPSCAVQPTTCHVIAPAAGSYDVLVYDPQRATTIPGVTLTVTEGVSPACNPI